MSGGTRLLEIAVVLGLLAAVVCTRLYRLQVEQHGFWSAESLKARTSSRILPFRRGAILDRQGRPIAMSESSYDLEFRFREFRKKSTVGQVLLADYLRTAQRRKVSQILADPGPVLEALEGLSVGEVRRMEPRRRRRDLLVYLSWLLCDPESSELGRRLEAGAREDLLAPRLRTERERIEERLWAEHAYLQDLELALEVEPGTLATRIDEEIAWCDAQVLRQLEAREEVERRFEVERALHSEYDDRDRLLVARVPHREFFHLEVEDKPLPGLGLAERTRRIYPLEHDACPVLVGTVGSPGEEDLASSAARLDRIANLRVQPRLSLEEAAELERLEERLRRDDVRGGEEIGRFGLEAAYEDALRGRRGWLKDIADLDSGGRTVLEAVPSEHGRDVQISLDSAMQQVAVRALERRLQDRGWSGAVVLLELPSVSIRVLASAPERSRERVEARGLGQDPQSDRPLRSQESWRPYLPLAPEAWRPFFPPPPGSVLKPLIAGMALGEGVIFPDTELLCAPGSLVANGRALNCMGIHNEVGLRDALIRSCNHYFARIAGKVGYQKMFDWTAALGFDETPRFADALLPGGERFELSSPAVVDCRLSRTGRMDRNLLLFGIGQGAIDDVTPLTVAAAMAALAQREYRSPVLIERVGDEVPLRAPPRPLSISPAHWRALVDMMRGVTADPHGTAYAETVPGLDLGRWDLASKTGTPQNGNLPDHSWFAGFFPARAPTYAFAIYLAHTGMHGGEVCAPILQEMLQDPAFAEVETAARRVDP